MEVQSFSARELFDWLVKREDMLVLDVRNDVEFARFKVEGPHPFDMLNVPYIEFVEMEDASVARVPKGKKIRVVCAKEGSSKFVAEILLNHGYADVAHMQVGIKAWGDLLVPVRIAAGRDYELYQFQRPGKASCSYGLLAGDEMMVFDPAKNVDFYLDFARQRGCTVGRTFETHRQADYISGSNMLRQRAGASIMAPESDFRVASFPFTPVRHGAKFDFAGQGPTVEAIHTPGHTPGSTCYLVDGKYLISGDTVFIHSIGRPDLGGMAEAWSKMLFHTMTQVIGPMPEETVVLPGHYVEWAEAGSDLIFAAPLKTVKAVNGEIYGMRDEKQFYAFIRANMRPQPEEYAKIREINAGLVEVDEVQQDIMDIGKNECAASVHQAA